jgi:hypothetical protein
MNLIERILSSHRHAAHAVQRSVASAAAYSEVGPNPLVRMRLYLSVLRQRFAQGG